MGLNEARATKSIWWLAIAARSAQGSGNYLDAQFILTNLDLLLRTIQDDYELAHFQSFLAEMAELSISFLGALYAFQATHGHQVPQCDADLNERVAGCLVELVDGALSANEAQSHKLAYRILDDLDYLIDAISKNDMPGFERVLLGSRPSFKDISDRAIASYSKKAS